MTGIRLAIPAAVALALVLLAACRNIFGGGDVDYSRRDLDDHGPPVHDGVAQTLGGGHDPMFAPRTRDAGAAE